MLTWIETGKGGERRRCSIVRIGGLPIGGRLLLEWRACQQRSRDRERPYVGCRSSVGLCSGSHQIRVKHGVKVRIEKR